LTTSNLKQTAKPVKPKINWARTEEADNFAETVKLYRQGKYDDASFRRYRLQHGAYGTRMTSDYAMVRIKLPAGEIYPHQFEKLSQLSEQYSIGNAHFTTRESVQLHWVILEDVSEILRSLAEVGMTTRRHVEIVLEMYCVVPWLVFVLKKSLIQLLMHLQLQNSF